MVNGFPERIERQMFLLAPPTYKIKVTAEPERKVGV
jgi:hypothetical protein